MFVESELGMTQAYNDDLYQENDDMYYDYEVDANDDAHGDEEPLDEEALDEEPLDDEPLDDANDLSHQVVGEDEREQLIKWHSKTTDEEKNDTKLRPKSSDPAWKYAILLKKTDSNGVKCLFCHWISTGGIGRMKGHFLGGDRNCIKCPKTTSFVRNEIREYVKEKKIKAMKGKSTYVDDDDQTDVIFVKENPIDPKKLKRPAVAVKKSISSSAGSINSNVKALSLNDGESLVDVVRNRKKQPLIVECLKKDERLIVDKLVAKAFYSAGIPFNVRNNIDFQVFFISIQFLIINVNILIFRN